MSDLKLYDVDLDGAVTYWVAARSPDECKSLIREIDSEAIDEPTEKHEWDIVEHDPALLADKMIRDDDSDDPSGKTPLVKLFRECDTPSVIACSEW